MIIGNIFSTTKVIVPSEFKVVDNLDKIDTSLPTLIVGWEYIDTNYPSYNILDRTLEPGLYWTFKRTERRELHDEDLYNFFTICYQKLVEKITYTFIDPIHFPIRMIKKCIRKFNSMEYVVTFENNDMYYIYSDNVILGIDLFLLKYMQLNCSKIISRIKNKSNIVLSGDEIKKEYSHNLSMLNNDFKYIPFLHSINQ